MKFDDINIRNIPQCSVKRLEKNLLTLKVETNILARTLGETMNLLCDENIWKKWFLSLQWTPGKMMNLWFSGSSDNSCLSVKKPLWGRLRQWQICLLGTLMFHPPCGAHKLLPASETGSSDRGFAVLMKPMPWVFVHSWMFQGFVEVFRVNVLNQQTGMKLIAHCWCDWMSD